MSANINFNREGIASYVENGKKDRAWHRLGQVYDRPLTVIEAIKGCNADFEVGLQPVIAATPQLETLINGCLSLDSETTKVINGKQFISVDMLKDLLNLQEQEMKLILMFLTAGTNLKVQQLIFPTHHLILRIHLLHTLHIL